MSLFAPLHSVTGSTERTLRQPNSLLAALPDDVYDALAPYLKPRALKQAAMLHHPGDEIHELYFPLDCMISVMVTMRDGRTAESAVVGNREMVGINAFMGGSETTQTKYVVQIAGDAVRVDAAPLRHAFDTDKRVRDLFLRYTQAYVAQLSQNTACNGLHALEQRYARWLLELRDRVRSDEIRTTHEFVSQMLGVRRAGISELAGRFERMGLVEAGRGRISILDRERLAAISCECYEVLCEEYTRLLGPTAPMMV